MSSLCQIVYYGVMKSDLLLVIDEESHYLFGLRSVLGSFDRKNTKEPRKNRLPCIRNLPC
jgi:hypothetical protein